MINIDVRDSSLLVFSKVRLKFIFNIVINIIKKAFTKMHYIT